VIMSGESAKESTQYKIFVKHILPQTTKKSLHQHFSQCGDVQFVSPAKEPMGNSKSAIVGFSDEEGMNHAISQLNYSMLDDRLLQVERYLPNLTPAPKTRQNFRTPKNKSAKKFAATTSITSLKKKIFNPKKSERDTHSDQDTLELEVASPPKKNRKYIKTLNKPPQERSI